MYKNKYNIEYNLNYITICLNNTMTNYINVNLLPYELHLLL